MSNGTLSFLADATNGTLHGRFHLLNTGRVRFPERDSLAEPSRFHLSVHLESKLPITPARAPTRWIGPTWIFAARRRGAAAL